MVINLDTNSHTIPNGGSLTLSSGGANFENIVGSNNNDTLTGNGLDNRLEGKAGVDTLIGEFGNDTYVFTGSEELDQDEVTEVADQGTDTLDFSGFGGPVDVDLEVTSQRAIHSWLDLTLTDDTVENVFGSNSSDTIYGNADANTLRGGDGDDELGGREGNDTYQYVGSDNSASSIDSIIDSDDIDTLDFAEFDAPLAIDLDDLGVQGVSGGITWVLLIDIDDATTLWARPLAEFPWPSATISLFKSSPC